MKKNLSITITLLILLLSVFYSLTNAQNTSLSKAEELLKKIDISKYPTPLYLQYIDSNGTELESLIKEALLSNKILIATKQKRDILQAKRIQAGLKPNPTIEVEFLTDELSNRRGEYEFNATYLQPIERGGKRKNRLKVVDLELLQLEKEIIFQEQKLRSEIFIQYINALANSEYLKLLEKLVGLNEENFQIVEVKFKEGDVAKLDLQLTELELNRWKIQQLQAELQVKASFAEIKFLVGLEEKSPLKLRTSFPFLEPKQSLLELESLALENRADLQALRLGEEIAQAHIDLALSQAKTNIDLFARYKEERKVEENLLGKLLVIERKIGGGISFSLPFYNRGQGDIMEATASKTQATYLREQLEHKIKQEVAIAFAQILNAQQTLKLYETNILPKAENNLKILQVAYQLGEQDLLNVITEQRKLIESQRDYLTIQKDYRLALSALERAIGKAVN